MKHTKFFIIFNSIYMAIAVACCVLTLVMPLTNTTATYTITPELMEKTAGKIEGVDYADIVGKDGTPVNMSIKIATKDLILSYTGGTTEEFFKKEILDPNVQSLAKEFSIKFNDVISKTVQAKLSVAIKDGIKGAIKDEISKFPFDDPQAVMDDVGLTDAYFAQVGTDTYAKITETGATLTKVVDFACSKIEEAYNMVGTKYPSSGFSGKKVDENQKADIRKQLGDALKSLNMLGTDGETIKPIECAVAAILDETLNDVKGSTADSVETVLVTYFNNVITPDMMFGITLGLKILFWVIMFMLVSWIVFFIITLERTVRKKYTFTGFWYWITFAFAVILGLLVFIAGYAYNAFIPEIIKSNPSLDYLKYLSFSAITSLTIPSFLLIAMAISYFWYHHYKMKVKRLKSEDDIIDSKGNFKDDDVK